MNEYTWTSPPGDTIHDILNERGLSTQDFADQMGLTPREAGDLIDGSAIIDPGIAKRLSETLGSTPGFWLERERIYRQYLHMVIDD